MKKLTKTTDATNVESRTGAGQYQFNFFHFWAKGTHKNITSTNKTYQLRARKGKKLVTFGAGCKNWPVTLLNVISSCTSSRQKHGVPLPRPQQTNHVWKETTKKKCSWKATTSLGDLTQGWTVGLRTHFLSKQKKHRVNSWVQARTNARTTVRRH